MEKLEVEKAPLAGDRWASMTAWWWVCDINRFPSLWREWSSRNLASLGWPPEYLRINPEERGRLDSNLRTLGRIKKGDRVVAYLKNHRIGGIGTFQAVLHTDDSSYDPLVEDEHGRLARVSWDSMPDSGLYAMAPEGRVPRRLRSIVHIRNEEVFLALEGAVASPDSWSPLADSNLLILDECPELHESILQSLPMIERGLRARGNTAHEFPAGGIGTIDVLAEDSDGNLVVIEAKSHAADDSTLGQLARYMGWVMLRMAGRHQKVRGIVVAGEFTPKIRFAASALSNVRLVSYRKVEAGRVEFVQVLTKREEFDIASV